MGDLSRWQIECDRTTAKILQTMTTASKAGKMALKQLMGKLSSWQLLSALPSPASAPNLRLVAQNDIQQ